MHKEEFLEMLNNALADENENGIERIIVFYKNGEKLRIGSEEIDNDVLEVESGVKKSAPCAKDDSTCNSNDWKYSNDKTEAKEISQVAPEVIYFPTGRKINVIY